MRKIAQETTLPEPTPKRMPWDPLRPKTGPGYISQPIMFAGLGAALANSPDIVRTVLNNQDPQESLEERKKRIRRRAIIGALLGAGISLPVGVYARRKWDERYVPDGVHYASSKQAQAYDAEEEERRKKRKRRRLIFMLAAAGIATPLAIIAYNKLTERKIERGDLKPKDADPIDPGTDTSELISERPAEEVARSGGKPAPVQRMEEVAEREPVLPEKPWLDTSAPLDLEGVLPAANETIPTDEIDRVLSALPQPSAPVAPPVSMSESDRINRQLDDYAAANGITLPQPSIDLSAEGSFASGLTDDEIWEKTRPRSNGTSIDINTAASRELARQREAELRRQFAEGSPEVRNRIISERLQANRDAMQRGRNSLLYRTSAELPEAMRQARNQFALFTGGGALAGLGAATLPPALLAAKTLGLKGSLASAWNALGPASRVYNAGSFGWNTGTGVRNTAATSKLDKATGGTGRPGVGYLATQFAPAAWDFTYSFLPGTRTAQRISNFAAPAIAKIPSTLRDASWLSDLLIDQGLYAARRLGNKGSRSNDIKRDLANSGVNINKVGPYAANLLEWDVDRAYDFKNNRITDLLADSIITHHNEPRQGN